MACVIIPTWPQTCSRRAWLIAEVLEPRRHQSQDSILAKSMDLISCNFVLKLCELKLSEEIAGNLVSVLQRGFLNC